VSRSVVIAIALALLAIPALGAVATAASPTCGGQKATIVGTSRSNLIRGTAGRDVIVARGGHDVIKGRGGRDVICGGAGRDTIEGGGGDDRLFGDDGNDTIRGGSGFDRLRGGAGKDACYPGAGGGTSSGCEPADLGVEISAPTSAGENEAFGFSVRITNLGGAPSGTYTFVLTQETTSVDCFDQSEVEPDQLSLGPGRWFTFTYEYDTGCFVEAGLDPHIGLTASVELSADADPSNDSDSARIEIVPASGG
jgi:hypothetical protein